MRKLLLMGASVAAITLPFDAHAALPTFDAAALAQALKSYAQEAASYARQGAQLLEAEKTVQWQIQQFQAFVMSPNLGAALGLMNQAGLGSSLPLNPTAIQGLLSGYGGISSKLGALSSLSNSSFNANTVYTCQDQSWQCQQQRANANGIAGAQGVGMTALQDIAAHIPIMQALRQNLASATTPAQRENAMAALQTEQLWAEQESNQLQSASLIYAAQRDARQERDDEALSQSFESDLKELAARGFTVPQ